MNRDIICIYCGENIEDCNCWPKPDEKTKKLMEDEIKNNKDFIEI
jgi:hypothetical protein